MKMDLFKSEGNLKIEDVHASTSLIAAPSPLKAEILHALKASKQQVSEQVKQVRDREGNLTNEISGSDFFLNEFRHFGEDAWDELKNRLAENGIQIDDEAVRETVAGLAAEKFYQDIFGFNDIEALNAELEADLIGKDGEVCVSAKWVRELQNHPNEDAIAAECLVDLTNRFPILEKLDFSRVDQICSFDPKVIEVQP
ncbi:MAG: hypothetical protein ACYCQK_01500 [Acidiferrobacteraceae bacterium]